MGEGDYFAYEGIRFKVLRSFPVQGVVGRRTRVVCGKWLQKRRLERVHLEAIAPHVITEDILEAIIKPHFSLSPIHLQEHDHVYMQGLECVAIRTEPADGLIDPSTVISWGGTSLPRAERVVLAPYRDDLPQEFLGLQHSSLISALFEFYIYPFFHGHHRSISTGEPLEIHHVTFRILEMTPRHGVVTLETVLVFDGTLLSRERGNMRMLVPLLSVSTLVETGHPEVSSMELALFRTRETRRILTHMLALINQMETGGVQENLDPTVLQQLPVRSLTSVPSNSDLRQCMICLSDFIEGENVRTLPCCKLYPVHFFHMECIDKWTQRSRLCPVCKHSVMDVDLTS